MDQSLLYAIAITVLLVSDVLLVVFGVLLYRRRNAGRDGSEVAQQIDELNRTLAPLAASLSGLDQRLNRIEERLNRAGERSEAGSAATARAAHREGDHRAFEVAARLVSQGAGVEELINICGLTRGEAELVRRLYGGSQAGGPSLVKDG